MRKFFWAAFQLIWLELISDIFFVKLSICLLSPERTEMGLETPLKAGSCLPGVKIFVGSISLFSGRFVVFRNMGFSGVRLPDLGEPNYLLAFDGLSLLSESNITDTSSK